MIVILAFLSPENIQIRVKCSSATTIGEIIAAISRLRTDVAPAEDASVTLSSEDMQKLITVLQAHPDLALYMHTGNSPHVKNQYGNWKPATDPAWGEFSVEEAKGTPLPLFLNLEEIGIDEQSPPWSKNAFPSTTSAN